MPGNTGDPHYDPAPWSSAAAAERLRSLIQQRQLSIAGLARALSVTRQTIHRWLQGQHISPGNLQRLSDYFSVDMVWLQNGSDTPDPNQPSGAHSSPRHLDLGSRAARMVIWEYDLDAGTIQWYGATAPVLGEDPSNLAIDALLDRVHASDRDRLLGEIRAASGGHSSIQALEVRLDRPGQDMLWVELWADLEYGADGTPARLIGSLCDISDRKKLHSDLATHRQLLDQMQNKLPIDIFLVDQYRQLQPLSQRNTAPTADPALVQQAVDSALLGRTQQLSSGSLMVAAAPLDANRDGHLALVLLIDTAALTAPHTTSTELHPER